MAERHSMAREIAEGLIAGATATWAMGYITNHLYEHESDAVRRRYQEVTGGEYVPERTAEKIESSLGLQLSEKRHQALAQTNHWVVGLTAGVLYALARRRVSRADWDQGVLFGVGFWLVFDEMMTVAAGVARPPREYPWQAHARGFAGHVAYGVVADTVLDGLERVPSTRMNDVTSASPRSTET